MQQVIRSADIGGGWRASENVDGSYTLRNPDKGQRIDVDADTAALFVKLYDESKAAD